MDHDDYASRSGGVVPPPATGNPGRPIWILTGFLVVFGCVTCLGLGVFVAWVGDDNPFAGPQAGGTAPSPLLPSSGATGVDLAPRHVDATITAVRGRAPVAVGTQCRFQVVGQALAQGGYWCNAQVLCAGQLLYGGPQAGFFPCQLDSPPSRHVVGQDRSTSSMDGDSAFAIDTTQGRLTVEDDGSGSFGAFRIEGKVDSVR